MVYTSLLSLETQNILSWPLQKIPWSLPHHDAITALFLVEQHDGFQNSFRQFSLGDNLLLSDQRNHEFNA